MIRQMLYFFFPYVKPVARFPHRMARDISNAGATSDQIILIERGLARNKEEAEMLIARYNASHALDVIEAIPPRKYSFRARMMILLMRMTGATNRHPHAISANHRDRMSYTARYRD